MDPSHISRLAGALNRIYRKLDLYQDENMQINPKEQLFLILVEESGPCRLKDIAAKVTLPLSTISWTVDRMVNKGYLKRAEDPSDRRATILDLDEKGRKAIAKFHELFESVSAAVAAAADETQFRNILSIVENLADTVSNKEPDS
jgi:MarR family transcriptional regulator, organic hydroperoxide resistance regulator